MKAMRGVLSTLFFVLAVVACRERGATRAEVTEPRESAKAVSPRETVTQAACPFTVNSYRELSEGSARQRLGPAAAVWMAQDPPQLRMLVPAFAAPFMSVTTAFVDLRDPSGRFAPGSYRSPRGARLDIADFRKRRMTAHSEVDGPGLRLQADVHQRHSDRVCLTLRVSGVVAFELQLTGPIVQDRVDATLWGQGIHRGLLDWPTDLPYRIEQREDGLGALCPPPATAQLSIGGRAVPGATARIEDRADGRVVRVDAKALGVAEIALNRDAAGSDERVVRYKLPNEGWQSVIGKGLVYGLSGGFCGTLDAVIAKAPWRVRFHLPTPSRRGSP